MKGEDVNFQQPKELDRHRGGNFGFQNLDT
jgi:hypothetical protein